MRTRRKINWLRAGWRRQIRIVTAAQNQIVLNLARDPTQFGFEVSEGLWCIEVLPLAAHYEIDDDANKVIVTSFSLIP